MHCLNSSTVNLSPYSTLNSWPFFSTQRKIRLLWHVLPWTELGPDCTPKNSISDSLKQPETITITFTIGSNRNAKEHKVFVVPDQGKFGVEWALTPLIWTSPRRLFHDSLWRNTKNPDSKPSASNFGTCWCKAMLSPHGVWSLPSILMPTKRRVQRMHSNNQSDCTLRVWWASSTFVIRSFVSFVNKRSQQ